MSEDVKPYGANDRPEDPTPDELRALIALTGLSQRKAAEALDLDERTMRYYASGQKPIPRVVIYALRHLVVSRTPVVTVTPELVSDAPALGEYVAGMLAEHSGGIIVRTESMAGLDISAGRDA